MPECAAGKRLSLLREKHKTFARMDSRTMTPVANRVCSQKKKNSSATWLMLAAVVALAGAGGCDRLKARDLLNKGVTAYANGQYDIAVEDFKQAKDLDPG